MKRSRHATQLTVERFQESRSYENQLATDLPIEQGVSICDRTVRRRMTELNLKDQKAPRTPYLSQQQIKNRLLWAKKYKDWGG